MSFEEALAFRMVDDLRAFGATPPPPETLYHYTGAAGLRGMIADHCLWFGDAFFLNDASEINYGFEMVKAAVDKWGEGKKSWQRSLAKALLSKTFTFSIGNRAAAFCMSDSGNLLNQWRDYGREEVSYSIGFKPESLRAALGKQPFMFLLKLIYDPGVQEQLVAQVAKGALELASAQPGADGSDAKIIDAIAESASLPLCVIIATLKHPDFAAEREWRLWTTVDLVADVQRFRPTPVGLAPYYEVKPREPQAKLPIVSVMVGPSPHGFVAEMGVKLLLRSSGREIDSVQTSHSQIPLRY